MQAMYQRGNFTPAAIPTEIAKTTASKKMPRKALGNPRMRACHVWATVEHDKTAETSQPKRVDESAASCHASIDRTKEVTKPMNPETIISRLVRRRHDLRASSVSQEGT